MRKTPILSLGRTASGSPPRHQHPLHQPEKTDFAISRPIVITSPMDGSPQSGSFPRNHPMALRCRRVGAVHSVIRVMSTRLRRASHVRSRSNTDRIVQVHTSLPVATSQSLALFVRRPESTVRLSRRGCHQFRMTLAGCNSAPVATIPKLQPAYGHISPKCSAQR